MLAWHSGLLNAYKTFGLACMTFGTTFMTFGLAYMTFGTAYMIFACMTFAVDDTMGRHVRCEHTINMDSGLLQYGEFTSKGL